MNIQLHDKSFEHYISEEEINSAIQGIASQIEDDFSTDDFPVFICVLNGAFLFCSDLVKHISFPCEVEFMKLSSYEGTASKEEISVKLGLDHKLKNRSVIVVEDIVDTGFTMKYITDQLKAIGVKDYKVASLFFKPDACKENITIDYLGFEIPNDFIVGYGLDYDGLGRNLKEVYKLSGV